jgi:excinuclease ABC subunit B
MAAAINETERRRAVQAAYNIEHNITPESIKKAVASPLDELLRAGTLMVDKKRSVAEHAAANAGTKPEAEIARLKKQMKAAAAKLEFERAADLRDLIRELSTLIVGG